jgi:hypothetical protein
MNKRQKKKHNKQFGNKTPRKNSNTERDRLGTMVIKDKKKEQNKRKCRGKINYE